MRIVTAGSHHRGLRGCRASRGQWRTTPPGEEQCGLRVVPQMFGTSEPATKSLKLRGGGICNVVIALRWVGREIESA